MIFICFLFFFFSWKTEESEASYFDKEAKKQQKPNPQVLKPSDNNNAKSERRSSVNSQSKQNTEEKNENPNNQQDNEVGEIDIKDAAKRIAKESLNKLWSGGKYYSQKIWKNGKKYARKVQEKIPSIEETKNMMIDIANYSNESLSYIKEVITKTYGETIDYYTDCRSSECSKESQTKEEIMNEEKLKKIVEKRQDNKDDEYDEENNACGRIYCIKYAMTQWLHNKSAILEEQLNNPNPTDGETNEMKKDCKRIAIVLKILIKYGPLKKIRNKNKILHIIDKIRQDGKTSTKQTIRLMKKIEKIINTEDYFDLLDIITPSIWKIWTLILWIPRVLIF